MKFMKFNEQRQLSEIPGTSTLVLNDILSSPTLTDLPENIIAIPIVVPSNEADARPMIALLPPGVLATNEGILDAVNTARQEFVQAGIDRDAVQQQQIDGLTVMQASMTSAQASIQTLLTEVAAKKSVVILPNVVVPAASLITVTATEKIFTQACVGIKTTDSVIVSPVSLPAGYGLRSWSIPANDQITIRVQCPVLSVGGSPITFSVTAFR